ncbi:MULTISPECIES: ATP-binding cassette domain-containing protein [unclassified Bacillus (in: firmicutes)]|uniref:ATP-binding cassette domain-containing protein n=1 Tax=unclassified Bacillus (in: firmicutes) TaxID=185979 RepID=UPI0008EC0BBC|nr:MULTISPECIES: ABC transporter ATP-binding protein [unclassified Bacillus (in: firmicutes)]SFI39210.1 ABC-2 type transport system ATP-binding protein [Bacillus sp. 71mf]SFT10952.1 ABC-2 type transport system ATP-binding protein [Bacillus sp. 103mf]
MINIENVSLKYGNTLALNNISLNLPEQAICGLIGRNGAGKTSLLSLLSAYRRPSSGTITISGENPYENRTIMPQIAYIYDNQNETENALHVKDLFKITAALRPNWDAAYAEKLMKLFEIPMKKTMGALSHGMRSAVHVIIGLAGQTPITIYDEAYLGMDAAVRKLFISELLSDYTQRPKLILFSTHFINEMEGLFSEAIIINKGQVIAHDDCDTLRSKGTAVTGFSEAVDSFVNGRESLLQRTLGRQKEAVLFGELSEQDRLDAAKAGLEFSQPSLQDLFIYMTEKGGKE